jgi:hypothetical protein
MSQHTMPLLPHALQLCVQFNPVIPSFLLTQVRVEISKSKVGWTVASFEELLQELEVQVDPASLICLGRSFLAGLVDCTNCSIICRSQP